MDDRFQNLKKRPQGCPYCGSIEIEEGLFEEEGGLLTRTDACPECDGSWRIEFAFREWVEVLHPSQLEKPAEILESSAGTVLSFTRSKA